MIIKEIRLAGKGESISWSRDKEEKYPETKGETVTIVDIGAIGVVRTNTYDKRLGYFDALVDEALKTFPCLSRSDFRVVQFGGDRYKRTMGVEFDVPGDPETAPEGWTPIENLEKTL